MDRVARRKRTGCYRVTTVVGEPVRAFVPDPLPPVPPVSLNSALGRLLEAATLALGRLDSVSALLPDISLLLYVYVRWEAVLSSQIEGTQSSLSDLLLFELEEAPGVPVDDAAEVSNYVAALQRGLELLADGLPLSNRLLWETHRVLLSGGRGAALLPGEFRRSQNWIGGTRPGNARYVPPPPADVPDCMAALERFIHAEDDLPVLVRAGLAHVQFETIHPFLDGNGRLGRLLITLMLVDAGVLHQPLLYLSLHFKRHRSTYYDLLDAVRRDGDWEAWLAFFLTGVRETAETAIDVAQRSREIFERDRKRIEETGRRRAGSALRVFDALRARPILTNAGASQATALSFPAASAAMQLLVELGIAEEKRPTRRAKLFLYRDYLRVLTEEKD